MAGLVLRLLLSLLPVCCFLGVLVYLDSYKLVRLPRIVGVIISGCVVAGAGFIVNAVISDYAAPGETWLVRYAAPAIEETLKALPVIFLLRRKRIGFLVDAAIFGFCVGAGFALVENLYYVWVMPDADPLLSVVRGFGTAIMHGGTTAVFAMIAKSLAQLREAEPAWIYAVALLPPLVIHSAFNHFLLSPVISALVIIVALPALMMAVFAQSERYLEAWLGHGFALQAELFAAIRSGEFTLSRPGVYLQTLRERFEGPVMADMLCYIRLKSELSLQAKGMLILRQNGLPVQKDEELSGKLAELRYLRQSIGKTGELALAPILPRTSHDAWELQMLAAQ